MTPTIALVVCISFVIFLLWLEHKQSYGISSSMWIPAIWMIYISSKPLGVWFHKTSEDVASGSSLDRAFLTILMFAALWVLSRRKFAWSSALKDNPWLMVLIIFMLVSILWSNIPSISFKRWIREVQAILMALVVFSEPSPRKAIETIIRRTAYTLIPFSLLLVKYFPAYGVSYGRWSGARMWIGVTQQKNGLGRLCMIVSFFLIWSLIRRWQGNNPQVWKYQTHVEIFVLLITFWLMRGPGGNVYSATSVIALGLSLAVYGTFYFIRKKGKLLSVSILMIIIVVIILYGIITVYTGEVKFSSLASAVGRNQTLTDRTLIWSRLVPVVKQKPLLGGGFGGFWTPQTRELYRISGAHSGYLDVLLELGFAGILLVSVYLLSSCRKAYRILSRDFDWGILWICYILMAVVHNVSESSINTLAMQLPAIILFFTLSSSSDSRMAISSISE